MSPEKGTMLTDREDRTLRGSSLDMLTLRKHATRTRPAGVRFRGLGIVDVEGRSWADEAEGRMDRPRERPLELLVPGPRGALDQKAGIGLISRGLPGDGAEIEPTCPGYIETGRTSSLILQFIT